MFSQSNQDFCIDTHLVRKPFTPNDGDSGSIHEGVSGDTGRLQTISQRENLKLTVGIYVISFNTLIEVGCVDVSW